MLKVNLNDFHTNPLLAKPNLFCINIRVQCTCTVFIIDVPRTILSAQTLIQGMFPPFDTKSNNYEDIQHLTLYTRDTMYDSIEANGR